MTPGRATAIALWALLAPALAWAQAPTWRPEVSASVGLGHVFRFEDQTYGDRLDAGAAIALAHRSGFVFELAANSVFGLQPKPAPCGLVDRTCVGDGRYGPRSAAMASLNAQYRFQSGRVQPYLTAGLGVLWTTSLHTTTYVRPNPAVMIESESSDRGFGPDLGAGVRFLLTPHLAISPEVRWLEAAVMSRENLAVTRLGVRASYGW